MAENKVEIEVELSGAKGVREGFKSISGAGKDLADKIGSSNEKLGEGIAGLGESVFSLGDAFKELTAGVGEVERGGSMAFTALLGPIGTVATATLALYETFRLISGASLEAEENSQAMAAAAADLQGKLEALAEKGVVMAANEMEKFSKMTLLAQVAKEKLQFSQEKLTKKTLNYIEAEENLNKAKKSLLKAEQEENGETQRLTFLRQNLKMATDDLRISEDAFNKSIERTIQEQIKVSTAIKKAEEKYISYEETSAEFLAGKIKENIETLKTLQLAEQEIKLSEQKFKAKKIDIEQTAALSTLQAEANKKNREELIKQNKELEKQIENIDRVMLANKTAAFQRKKLAEESRKQREAEQKRRKAAQEQAERNRQQADRIEEQRQFRLLSEEARISQLRIELDENETDKARQLALLRYNTALSLAKDNRNQQTIAELQYQKELTQIDKTEEAKRLQNEKRLKDESRAFELESRQFYIEQIDNETERELAKLDLQYERRYEMAKGNQERIKDLESRYLIERMKIMNKETDELKNRFSELFSSLGEGLAESAAGALVLGESFKKSIVGVLQSLAKEAAVQALMETAKGTAALFLNPAQAANHFAAAGIFAGAATAAGVAGSALSTSAGGGGGGGGSNFSPSGAPQSAQTVQDRPQAQEQTLVFNVNFSGAVVYDTKKAAEQALADRVTNIMNRRRRGAPR